ncbi:prolyl oligopeptidase-like protein [Tirmania nivea]|nr:prolyl oligopeptidase-like protein [Tirmania nivea]
MLVHCGSTRSFMRTVRPLSVLSVRTYSSTTTTVPLAYTLHEPPKGTVTVASPMVVMHGLFGSKQNNRSISKMFAKDLKRPVYAVVRYAYPALSMQREKFNMLLDLRNHGDSPHHQKHNYIAIAEDVEHFIQEHGLKDVTLLGHSMGAKTAMAVSLRRPDLVRDIIAVDNAPVEAMLGSSFGQYVQAMRRIEDANLQKQSEADLILKEYEPEMPIRQFLLTNLVRSTSDSASAPSLKFRIPVKILARALDDMAGFPFHPDKTRFEKPALFIRGTKSHYVPDEVIPLIGKFFPYFRLRDVEAGHWVISENPGKFREVVLEFLQPQE